MPEHNPFPRRSGPVDSARATRDRAPSPVAAARLSDALRERARSYQQDASVDLTMLEAFLRLDRPEAAAKTLDDHRASLQAMVRDLQEAVADAAVEREAELVCSAAEQLQARSVPTRPVRRRLLAAAGAAAVALALMLPAARFGAPTTLTSAEAATSHDDRAAARQRLNAARSRARAVRQEATGGSRSQSRTAAPPRFSDAVVPTTLRRSRAADVSGGSAAPGGVRGAQATQVGAPRAKDPPREAVRGDDRPPADEDPPAAGGGPPGIGADTPTTDVPLGIDIPVDDAAPTGLDVPLGAGDV